MHKPVAKGSPPAPDVLQLEGDYSVSKECKYLVNRPGKNEPQIGPPHGLGKGNSRNDLGNDGLKKLLRGLPLFGLPDRYIVTLFCRLYGQPL